MVFENLFSLTDFSSFLLFEAFDNNAWDRYLRVISHVSSRIGTLNRHNSVADPSRPGGGGGGGGEGAKIFFGFV